MKSNKVNIYVIIVFFCLMMVSCKNSIRVNEEFRIEYMEMFSSISLNNGAQGFVSNVTKAYWNNDSLVVSGDEGCFLIVFGITEYNDEKIEIKCEGLDKKLKAKPIKKYIRK